jgi:hypothetical protein
LALTGEGNLMQQEFAATAGAPALAASRIDSAGSGVVWSAIFGGAAAGAALSLVLLALGSGFGLASVSAWANTGVSLTTFTWITAAWLIVVQWVSSGIGGYITGRLRVGWAGLHTHEVFFRDTANGFLSWATGVVIVTVFLASAMASLLGGATDIAASGAAGAAQGATQSAAATGGSEIQSGAADPTGYLIDTLFRSDHASPANGQAGQDPNAEARRILAMGVQRGDLPAADRTYLAQLVAARTGISQPDAEKRVDDVVAQEKAAEIKARAAAEKARKAASALSIFTGLAMLIGAFIASAAAALGGQHRDEAKWENQPARI